ncbi:hypothetical protein KUTeg_000662 [Tegillarca granosa]|uniref:Myotrophin n=1 Tax=Tegillarca granosa TaxID=220873 RepID=A0ABQ9FY67_TEGGR|nr:hypothetical protein KUTeg_000662 [Tegillarca granosa]
MVKIKEKLFYNILDGLAANEKWRQMVTLVQEHRRHHGEYSLRDFAKKVNIPKVIAHSTFRGSEPLLLETIANMLDSGAVLEKDGKLAVLAAIQEEHFKVLAELLRRGANPDLLTLTVGDTPEIFPS